jgi:Raf kinase inhibitor-like YbhB/YbcL family protein
MVAPVLASAAPATLRVTVAGLEDGGKLPLSAAFCAPPSVPPDQHNISPGVSWSAGPPGTRSYALIMSDLDVPADLGLINKPGVVIPVEAPRMAFVHWLLVDIPPSITRLEPAEESNGFKPGPRPPEPTDHGVQGANVYSGYYPKGSPLAGPRGGYDGPCPPPNDLKGHRYVTRVYALDVKTLGLDGAFLADAAERRMAGHVLAVGEAEATYGPIRPAR